MKRWIVSAFPCWDHPKRHWIFRYGRALKSSKSPHLGHWCLPGNSWYMAYGHYFILMVMSCHVTMFQLNQSYNLVKYKPYINIALYNHLLYPFVHQNCTPKWPIARWKWVLPRGTLARQERVRLVRAVHHQASQYASRPAYSGKTGQGWRRRSRSSIYGVSMYVLDGYIYIYIDILNKYMCIFIYI